MSLIIQDGSILKAGGGGNPPLNTLPWTGLFLDFPGTTWPGTPSSGISGSKSFSGGTPPTVGTTLNGKGVAVFTSATNWGGGTFSDYIDNGDASSFFVAKTSAPPMIPFLNVDLSLYFGIITNAGIQSTLNHGTGGPSAGNSTDWMLAQWDFVAATGQCRLRATVGGVTTSFVLNTPVNPIITTTGNASGGFGASTGQCAGFGTIKTKLTNDQHDAIRDELRTYWGGAF